MKRRSFLWTASAVAALTASAQVELGAPFADGAVLQRGMKVPVWGTAAAGAGISVAFAGQSVSTTVGTNGVWQAAKIVNFRKAKNAQGRGLRDL